jgi:hypothetical protein
MENNMVIFEFDRQEEEDLKEIVDNFSLVNAGNFDVCIFASSDRTINYKNGIHVWIRSNDYENSHLMILLSFIIQGHHLWRKSEITIFDICKKGEEQDTKMKLEELVLTGRLPITSKNIQVISEMADRNTRGLINEHSAHAGLTIIGFHSELLKHEGARIFRGYDEVGNILFVNAHSQKEIS